MLSGEKARSFQMASIPLDLQKRCEQRWAARFSRPAEPIVALKHRIERQDQELAALAKVDAEAALSETSKSQSSRKRPDPHLAAA
jgi:hypothetical protein